MKVLVSVVLLAAVVLAEPPRYRQQYQPQRQYYFARQQEEAAPYLASGWRPAGTAFNLPQTQPKQQYGAPSAPQPQYGTPTNPQNEYGVPEEPTTTEVANSTEEEEEVSTVQGITDSESEPVQNAANELEDEDTDERQPQQTGEYYVALPDGRLQRVRYISRQNVEAMKYFAKIRAENVEPLRGPIYAYAPLQKLQIVPTGLQRVSIAPVAATDDAKPQKFEIEPVAAQVQYQYDNPPPSVVPLAYAASYRAPNEPRYILAFQ